VYNPLVHLAVERNAAIVADQYPARQTLFQLHARVHNRGVVGLDIEAFDETRQEAKCLTS
jgi:hypothetical protein